MDLAQIRQEYDGENIATLPMEPHRGIELWLAEALKVEEEATAFSLATLGERAELSVRVVLAKNVSSGGVTFYTNKRSLKGGQLSQNPVAAGVFFWAKLHRQVRFEGRVSPVSDAEADAYFNTRPRASQIAAVVSQQSAAIESYEKLQSEFEKAEKNFDDKKIPRPAHWGGYLVSLERVEFWQGKRSRLHQRLLYERSPDGLFTRRWLQP